MPPPIRCGAQLADGENCEERAIVTNIRYSYDIMPSPCGRGEFVLKAVHYDALCPNCGERTLSEQLNA